MSEMRFRDEDFETFTVDGLDERMTVLKRESDQSLKHLVNILHRFFLLLQETKCLSTWQNMQEDQSTRQMTLGWLSLTVSVGIKAPSFSNWALENSCICMVCAHL